MTILSSAKEISELKDGGKILASILNEVADKAKPGISAAEMDELAEKLIRQSGGLPSFKNYKTADDKKPYPSSLCVSVNDEVVHGIPYKNKILKNGDVVGLDLGMKYKNLHTDMAVTVGVGNIGTEAERLIEVCRQSLDYGIAAVKAGVKIGDIGQSVQYCAEKSGFGVVRKLVGHGLGYKAHEPPEIPNFGIKGKGGVLKEGMVIAIEPMITAGGYDIYLDDDLWTWRTKDSSLAAHFEHTILVAKTGAEIITRM